MPVETALVVDDSKSARVMLSRMVQKVGLQVEMVESGEAAISYLEENPHPDVIFMDHMMPGMDGLATTQALVANEATRHIPIFMYTSKEGPEYEDEMKACGAYGMLGKPAKPERLREIIEELNARPAVVEAATPTAEEAPAEVIEEPLVAEEEDITLEEPAEAVTAEPEAPEPVTADEPEEPIVEEAEVEPAFVEPIPPEPTPEPIPQEQEPVIASEEEEEMSKEFIEEVATPLVARAIEDAVQPLKDAIHRLETLAGENQSEIRKLNSRQANTVNMVTQPVLDASLKQTTVQLQNQLTNEIKSLRELIEQRADLSPEILAKIQEVASKHGSDAGQAQAEKTANSVAEAAATKISAAQTQIQVEQELTPYLAQTKRSSMLAVIALIVAAGAVAAAFVL